MEKLFPDSIHQVYEAEKSQEQIIVAAIPSVVGFLRPDYETYNNTSGSGFILDNQGTILTAHHVYEQHQEKWHNSKNISLLTDEGIISYSGLELVVGDEEQDYAILKSPRLAGRGGIPISKSPSLTYDKPYYMVGYPHAYRHFPYHFQCAVSIGQRKVEENPFPEIQREYLWCSIMAGFSGAPILDTKGFARAIALSGFVSFTSGDNADVLPLSAIDNIVRKIFSESGS